MAVEAEHVERLVQSGLNDTPALGLDFASRRGEQVSQALRSVLADVRLKH